MPVSPGAQMVGMAQRVVSKKKRDVWGIGLRSKVTLLLSPSPSSSPSPSPSLSPSLSNYFFLKL